MTTKSTSKVTRETVREYPSRQTVSGSSGKNRPIMVTVHNELLILRFKGMRKRYYMNIVTALEIARRQEALQIMMAKRARKQRRKA